MSDVQSDLRGYDRLYAGRAGKTLWGDEPGRLVLRSADWTRGPGRALDAGCGDGKNASWLTRHGWVVTGLDQSKLALDLLRGRTPRLSGHFRRQDLSEFLLESQETFDLIVSYGLFHCLDASTRVNQHRELQDRLQTGGVMLFSTLTDVLPWPAGHGTSEFHLATAEEVHSLTEDFDLLHVEDGFITEEHLPHVGIHQHSSSWRVLARPA